MATEKLFWADPYLTRCEAVVTSVNQERVTVDRTVAFAFSGGQASDAGTISGREIVAAEKRGKEIVYKLPSGHGLCAGDAVLIEIDGEHRARLRRLHFAAELVLELVTRELGAPPKLGANITAEKARVDFAWAGSIAPALSAIELELRRIVEADLPITSAFADEAAELRYWDIEGFARVECGGTHPYRTSEVGAVALRRANPGAGKERIEIRLID